MFNIKPEIAYFWPDICDLPSFTGAMLTPRVTSTSYIEENGLSTLLTIEQVLQDWNAARTKPPLPPRVITAKVRSAYSHGYTSYGCEDQLIIPFCDESYPIKQKMLAGLMVVEGEIS